MCTAVDAGDEKYFLTCLVGVFLLLLETGHFS